MSDWNDLAVPTHISTFSRWILGNTQRVANNSGAPTTTATGTSNRAGLFAMSLPWPYYVQRVFWINGSSVGLNVDMGVYTLGGGKIFNVGSTAQSGTSAIQYVSLSTPVLLNPGWYFLVFNISGTTANTLWGTGFGSFQPEKDITGFMQADTTVSLGSSLTPSPLTTFGPAYEFCGITNTPSGF